MTRNGQTTTEFIVMLAAITSIGLLIGYIFLGSDNKSGGARVMPQTAATRIQADPDK